jgi:diguanylate cyclase
LKGVLAAHADWSWAQQVLKTALPEDAAEKGIEVFIVNKQGRFFIPIKVLDKFNSCDFAAAQSLFC